MNMSQRIQDAIDRVKPEDLRLPEGVPPNPDDMLTFVVGTVEDDRVKALFTVIRQTEEAIEQKRDDLKLMRDQQVQHFTGKGYDYCPICRTAKELDDLILFHAACCAHFRHDMIECLPGGKNLAPVYDAYPLCKDWDFHVYNESQVHAHLDNVDTPCTSRLV